MGTKQVAAALLGAWAAFVILVVPAARAEPPASSVPAVVDHLRRSYGVSPASAPSAAVEGLAGLVELERRHFPGAYVSSGFYDWRTVSRYRSHAGLHLGYDIVMPYGTAVSAGWPGTVTSVAQWYGSEYGITVLSPSGSQVTYGHLSPLVNVGQEV